MTILNATASRSPGVRTTGAVESGSVLQQSQDVLLRERRDGPGIDVVARHPVELEPDDGLVVVRGGDAHASEGKVALLPEGPQGWGQAKHVPTLVGTTGLEEQVLIPCTSLLVQEVIQGVPEGPGVLSIVLVGSGGKGEDAAGLGGGSSRENADLAIAGESLYKRVSKPSL